MIILHMSTINKNQIMYDSWEMEHDKQSFFSFWTNFNTPPHPITTQRIKSLKKWKKALDTSSF